MSNFRGLCLVILLLPLGTDSALSQGIRRRPRNPPEFPPFNLSGTLERLEVNCVVLTTEAGYTWVLQPKPKVQVQLTAKALPAFLAPGQCIAFLAKIDKRRGAAVEPVRRLTVFMPDKKRQFGIQPDLGFGELEKETFKGKEGVRDATSPEDQTSTSRTGSPAAVKVFPKNVESFVIHGRILSKKKGELLVQVPNNVYTKPNLKVTVAEDAEIDVELTGAPALALVRLGDHVQARGDQVGEAMGRANMLTFRAAQPLGTPPSPKKPPAKKKPEPPKKKPNKK